jgi:hypothetical protein
VDSLFLARSEYIMFQQEASTLTTALRTWSHTKDVAWARKGGGIFDFLKCNIIEKLTWLQTLYIKNLSYSEPSRHEHINICTCVTILDYYVKRK